MSEGSATYRDIVESFRPAGFPSFIKDQAWSHGLELKIENDKRWFRETTRFEVSGPTERVMKFKSELAAAISEYNSR